MMSVCDQQGSGTDIEAIIDQPQKVSYPEEVPRGLKSTLLQPSNLMDFFAHMIINMTFQRADDVMNGSSTSSICQRPHLYWFNGYN